LPASPTPELDVIALLRHWMEVAGLVELHEGCAKRAKPAAACDRR
jgi:hypothetical protein